MSAPWSSVSLMSGPLTTHHLTDADTGDKTPGHHHLLVLRRGLDGRTDDEDRSGDGDWGQRLCKIKIYPDLEGVTNQHSARGAGKNMFHSLAVLRLKMSATYEAGILPTKAPRSNDEVMKPI